MDADQRFGILLKQVYHLWHAVINERLRPRGVSHSQWRVVLMVSRSEAPLTQTALAAELGIESPTVVRLLDRLAAKGWIAREPCPADRRARLVRLTPRAQRLARELEVVVGEVRRELLRDLGAAELAASVAALSKVEARALQALAESRRQGATAPGAGRVRGPIGKPRSVSTVAARRVGGRRALPKRSAPR
jgi:MarR family transcriptional regulator for hemolysin